MQDFRRDSIAAHSAVPAQSPQRSSHIFIAEMKARGQGVSELLPLKLIKSSLCGIENTFEVLEPSLVALLIRAGELAVRLADVGRLPANVAACQRPHNSVGGPGITARGGIGRFSGMPM